MELTLDLPDSLSRELQKQAKVAGASVSEYIISELQRLQTAVPQEAGDTHPLLVLADRVRTELSADDDIEFPTDFARKHDHYIHGAVKP